jgi:hypothetical protein
VPLADIEEITDATSSIMPDDLHRALSPQDLRDLFAYLQGDAPGRPD